jgi:hypothetical protein
MKVERGIGEESAEQSLSDEPINRKARRFYSSTVSLTYFSLDPPTKACRGGMCAGTTPPNRAIEGSSTLGIDSAGGLGMLAWP